MLFGTQRSWFVRPERRCKDVLGFQLESRQHIVDHVRSRNFLGWVVSAALDVAVVVLSFSKRYSLCWVVSVDLASAFLVLFCSKRACLCWGVSAALPSEFLVLFRSKRACRCWGVSTTFNNFNLREFGSSPPVHFRFHVAMLDSNCLLDSNCYLPTASTM
jgi:hypothetical protein